MSMPWSLESTCCVVLAAPAVHFRLSRSHGNLPVRASGDGILRSDTGLASVVLPGAGQLAPYWSTSAGARLAREPVSKAVPFVASASGVVAGAFVAGALS